MAKSKGKGPKPTGKFKEFVKSERFAKLRGAAYMLMAVYAFFALVSFFVKGCPIDDLHDNWMGVVGGWMAKVLAANTFGIGAFGLLFLLFLYGLKLWKVRPLPLAKTLGCTLFWMAWVAIMNGYAAYHWLGEGCTFENYAGSVGLIVAQGLYGLIAWFTFVLLLFIAVAFLIFVHKVRIKIDVEKMKARHAERMKQRERRRAEAALKAEQKKKDKEVEAGSKAEKEGEKEEGKEAEDETVKFSIDDEFERIMRKAQEENGMAAPEPAAEEGPEEEPEQELELEEAEPDPIAPAGGEPTFNIADTSAPVATAPEQPEAETEPEGGEEYSRHFGVDELFDPHLDLKDFKMPTTDLLEDWEVKNAKVTKEELVANKDRIVATLRDYGIEITEITASPGPTVTLYEIKPAPGVRISKIKSLEDDIALSLAAAGIRIIAPIPGRGTIGIEVPNTNPQIVSMKTMLESDAFKNNKKMELPVALGKTISNEPYVTDLAKMPHLLMAGATGTGKSVGLNAVIASLLYKKHPTELKFVMVDPKKVELSLYSKIERQYLAKLPDSEEAVITDVKKVVRTLNSLCIEMDQRYDLLKNAGVRKITEYNDKFIHRHLNPMTEVTPGNNHRYLPYIVLVIDEFADLIMTAGKEIEAPICRLAQLARAVGIHLIIATQRPTTNIITGTIKANFPARIAFKVTSGVDSKTILDQGGAQRLIGRGDMLISLSGSDLIRLQCALMETSECEKLSEFIGEQRGLPDGFLLPEYLDENDEPTKDFDPKQKDEFFNDAARLVVSSQFGSTSLLQRKLQLGYNRAGRIIDQLEAAGIVGPYNGSKARDVLIKDEVELEEILRNL